MINKILSLVKSKEFQKFFIIGITAFAIDFVLLQIFIKVFNVPEEDHLKQTIANLCSAAISIAYNYTVQRKWAFKSTNANVTKEAGKFISVHIFNLIVFQTILFSLVNYFLPSWITKIGVTGIQIISSFVLYKYFVFETKPTEEIIESSIESGLN